MEEVKSKRGREKKQVEKVVEEKTEVKEEKKKIVPKLFIQKDEKIKVELVGYHSGETGELVLLLPRELAETKENFDNILIRKEYQFVFTKVTFDKLNRYRNRAMIYNSQDKNNTINGLKLREYFLIFHLVDWNIEDEEGKKIELTFDSTGALSDEILDLIYSLPSNMLDMVLATYEKKMNIAY